MVVCLADSYHFKFNNTKQSFLDELAAVHHHIGVVLACGAGRSTEVVVLCCPDESEYLEVSIGTCGLGCLGLVSVE